MEQFTYKLKRASIYSYLSIYLPTYLLPSRSSHLLSISVSIIILYMYVHCAVRSYKGNQCIKRLLKWRHWDEKVKGSNFKRLVHKTTLAIYERMPKSCKKYTHTVNYLWNEEDTCAMQHTETYMYLTIAHGPSSARRLLKWGHPSNHLIINNTYPFTPDSVHCPNCTQFVLKSTCEKRYSQNQWAYYTYPITSWETCTRHRYIYNCCLHLR